MKLKSKLIFTCIAFVVTLSFLMMGVFAMKNVNFDMGGSIGFSASGITATISQGTLSSTGLYKNAEDEGTKMKEVKIDTSMTNSDLKNLAEYKSWQNLQFLFNDKGEDVTIKFTVTNTSTKGDNFTVDVTYGAEQSKNASIDVSPTYAMLTPGDAQEFTVTFAVTEKGTDASLSGFNIGLNMQYFEAKDASTYSNLMFDYVENLSTGTETVGVNTASATSATSSMRELYVGSKPQNMPNVETLTIPGYVLFNNELCRVTTISPFFDQESAMKELPEEPTEQDITAIMEKYAPKVTNIILPNTITTLLDYAFSNCIYTESISLGNNILSMGEGAFAFTAITEISLPDSVEFLGDSVFGNCSALISVKLPKNITSIGQYAFALCTSLSNITLPESVETIGDYGFHYCENLTSINLKNITNIGEYAFSSCYNLSTLDLHNVTAIGDYAFDDCSNITDISFNPEIFDISNNNSPFVNTSLKNVTIVEGSKKIPSYMFANCTSLVSVSLPDGLTTIGYFAFHGCTSLENINLPESLTTINGSAFSDCISLTSIDLPEKLTSIDGFGGSGIVSITIPEGVTTIPSSCFSRCASLTTIVLPKSITTIETYAFLSCTSLESINIPEGVTTIPTYCFKNCSSLNTIVLPKSITTIKYNAFENCGNLANVYYTGTEAEWALITIESSNVPLKNATLHPNYVMGSEFN